MTTMVAPAGLRFRAMGSDVHVLVNGPAGLLQVARDRVEELERRWSRFRADSEISRLNALAGSPMVVSAETLGLDPGGIGKGYAADLVVSELRAAGAAGVCVNLGGDLRAEGRAPGGGSWVVGIEHPLRPGPAATVTLAGGAVATSSRTRRTWGPDGDRRHHLIDPATGAPADTALAAVTVLAARGWQAEVLAKAAFLGGLDRGRALLTVAGADGLLVDDHGGLHPSGGFGRFLVGDGAGVHQ
jgi:thiamine biosynthesis lipoprotein ApbE